MENLTADAEVNSNVATRRPVRDDRTLDKSRTHHGRKHAIAREAHESAGICSPIGEIRTGDTDRNFTSTSPSVSEVVAKDAGVRRSARAARSPRQKLPDAALPPRPQVVFVIRYRIRSNGLVKWRRMGIYEATGPG